jgi:hypothetical protein
MSPIFIIRRTSDHRHKQKNLGRKKDPDVQLATLLSTNTLRSALACGWVDTTLQSLLSDVSALTNSNFTIKAVLTSHFLSMAENFGPAER